MPARAGMAYEPPTLPKGKAIKGTRKIANIMDSFTKPQKKTADFLTALCCMQQIVGDKFDRLAKGQPPREAGCIFTCPIDLIYNGTSEELDPVPPPVCD